MAASDYNKLHALLDKETYPLAYTHKFIGRNTARFTTGVQALEAKFPKLTLQTARTSKGEAHLALTYEIVAENAGEIIEILEATGQLEDLHLVL
jgi:hypothetical protein